MTKPPTDVAEMSDSALVAKHFPGKTPSDEFVPGVTFAAEARAIENNERKQLKLADVKAGRTSDEAKPKPTARQARAAAKATKSKGGDVTPIPKGSTRAPQKRKEAPVKANGATSPKEGADNMATTTKRAGRKTSPAKKAPATKRAAAKKQTTRRPAVEVPAGKTLVRVAGAASAVLRKDAAVKALFNGTKATEFAKGSSTVLVLGAADVKKLAAACKRYTDSVANLPRGERVQSVRIAERACAQLRERLV